MGLRSWLTRIDNVEQYKQFKELLDNEINKYYDDPIAYLIVIHDEQRTGFRRDDLIVAWDSDGRLNDKTVGVIPYTILLDDYLAKVRPDWNSNPEKYGRFIEESDVNKFFEEKLKKNAETAKYSMHIGDGKTLYNSLQTLFNCNPSLFTNIDIKTTEEILQKNKSIVFKRGNGDITIKKETKEKSIHIAQINEADKKSKGLSI